MIRVIFFDIDGTLLSHRTGLITEITRNVLKKLQEQGIKCVAATGRHLLEIAELPARELEFDGYLTLNGQLCLDREKKIVYENPISGADQEYLLALFQARQIPVMFIEENRMYINFVNRHVEEVQAAISTSVPDVGEYLGAQVYQVVVYIEKGQETEIERHLISSKTTRWNSHAVDILPAKGGKVAGIQQYLLQNGISREETMAFGDGENDADMLKFAGIGVAMGNAGENVKANADYVTASVDEEGVARAIQYFEEKEKLTFGSRV